MEGDMSLRELIDQNPYFNYVELIREIENERNNRNLKEGGEVSRKITEKMDKVWCFRYSLFIYYNLI